MGVDGWAVALRRKRERGYETKGKWAKSLGPTFGRWGGLLGVGKGRTGAVFVLVCARCRGCGALRGLDGGRLIVEMPGVSVVEGCGFWLGH